MRCWQTRQMCPKGLQHLIGSIRIGQLRLNHTIRSRSQDKLGYSYMCFAETRECSWNTSNNSLAARQTRKSPDSDPGMHHLTGIHCSLFVM